MTLADRRTAEAVRAFRRATLTRKRAELETAMDLTAAEALTGRRPVVRRSTTDGMLVVDEFFTQEGEPVSAPPETNDVITALSKAIVANPDMVFQIVGPITTTVNIPGKGYRHRPFKGGEELFLRGVRVGKKNDFVFEFEPLDAQEYDRVEFVEDKVFPALVGFETALIHALLPDAPADMTWHNASVTYQAQVEAERKLAEEAAAAARAGDQTHKNPNYGMFA